MSEFFGISVYIYWRDHGPPHFHAYYGEHEAAVRISDGLTLRGWLPPRARGLLIEWVELHRDELEAAWHRAARYEDPGTIQPLG